MILLDNQTNVRRLIMNRLTGKVSSMAEMIDWVKQTPDLMSQVTYWDTIRPRDAMMAPFPAGLHEGVIKALRGKGIDGLYTHQASSYDAVMQGKNIVTVTPTASGKTMCYNLPVLQVVLNDDSARALYL